MKKLVFSYFNTFNGLSKEVWWLALITLINRAGTMVIPFLSLYLTQSLDFSLSDVGWIMALFGLGSVIGSWLGGKLTDRIGYYKVMVISLLASGVSFILLQYITTFVGFCVGVLVLMGIADMFRPAMFVALSSYSKPENRTRSITLIRLAINLGFSAGPALGGLIIFALSYGGLFWVDGITCFIAGMLLLKILNPRKAKVIEQIKVVNPTEAYTDKAFMILLVGMTLFGLAFFQLLSTLPLYYKDVHHLTEAEIGLLLGLNGFLIFIFEMPLIKWLESSKNSMSKLILIGVLLTAMSFIVINLTGCISVLQFLGPKQIHKRKPRAIHGLLLHFLLHSPYFWAQHRNEFSGEFGIYVYLVYHYPSGHIKCGIYVVFDSFFKERKESKTSYLNSIG